MSRTVFLVDGFNLYHSLKEFGTPPNGNSTRWLDLKKLCQSYMHHFGKGATLQDVYYFSALAYHRNAVDPDTTTRHEAYIKCIQNTGVKVELARFKEKPGSCRKCGHPITRYEEKETDVAIATKLIELLVQTQCERIVLVSGDTDLAPAVRCAQRLFPKCSIWFAFPVGRKNKELAALVPGQTFKMTSTAYMANQLPDPYVLGGITVVKPSNW